MAPSKQPALIIIVRHGARLDAADKQWHLASPTPYDPPLTYGGWTQCRALGARIANILDTREALPERSRSRGRRGNSPNGATSTGQGESSGQARRKKHKITIHTSPFLRCIQTSIAISAGLAQYRGAGSENKDAEPPRPPRLFTPSNNHVNGAAHSDAGRLSTIKQGEIVRPKEHLSRKDHSSRHRSHPKPDLRIDAFLGEWLTPDYYEAITSPPGSVMMLASAKAELLRRPENLPAVESAIHSARTAHGHFPGGWANLIPPTPPPEQEQQSEHKSLDMSELRKALPGRDRAASNTTLRDARSRSRGRSPNGLLDSLPNASGGYTPPKPLYAISPSDPIPTGYVAHARDACLDVDFQWDSMRAPHAFGDGGEYGEEWSSMHKRFRHGMHRLVTWHQQAPATKKQYSESGSLLSPVLTTPQEQEEEDFDLVVIVVTHGAGCNALIGALTDQPALLDVGLASLTMAERKSSLPEDPIEKSRSHGTSVPTQLDNDSFTLSQLYDIRVVASTEHLRSSSHTHSQSLPVASGLTGLPQSPLSPHPQSPLPRISTQLPSFTYRQRFNSNASVNSVGSSTATDGGSTPTFSFSPSTYRRPSLGTNSTRGQRSFSGTSVASAPNGNGLGVTLTPSSGLGGLWNSKRAVSPAGAHSPSIEAKDWFASYGDNEDTPIATTSSTPEKTSQAPATTTNGTKAVNAEKDDSLPSLKTMFSNRTNSPRSTGLWGASPTAFGAESKEEPVERAGGDKRRWTIDPIKVRDM
ncbi:hypothetical protein MMC25_004280 [Agyrium rufum]|nr:hypothetical protein [Agyrium rufum]